MIIIIGRFYDRAEVRTNVTEVQSSQH